MAKANGAVRNVKGFAIPTTLEGALAKGWRRLGASLLSIDRKDWETDEGGVHDLCMVYLGDEVVVARYRASDLQCTISTRGPKTPI